MALPSFSINIRKALNNSNVRVVSWASYNKDGIVGKTVEALCKDYEAKNPGYKVLAGINADYFNLTTLDTINALVMNGDVIKNVNHAKYNSLAIGDDFKDD